MKSKIIIVILLVAAVTAVAQDKSSTVPQGSSIPGLAGIPLGMSGPGFFEFGGSHSNLSNGQDSWNDAYLRGQMSGGNNAFDGELIRQARFGDAGWFYNLGWTRTISENWYSDVHFGSSTVGGFFLPKVRVDGFINRKLLPRKQFVLTLGGGYDKSKSVNSAARAQIGGTYYFDRPFILQGGVTFTRAQPGSVLARSQYAAITQGHDKEHYLTLRAEIGREAYELVGPQTTLFDFVVHNYSANWRQWVGVNWGFNAAFEHEGNFSYHRNGGTFGLFLDF